MKEIGVLHKIVFVRKVLGPVKIFVTKMIFFEEFTVLLNRVIGPVKQFKTKMKNGEGLKKFGDIRAIEITS